MLQSRFQCLYALRDINLGPSSRDTTEPLSLIIGQVVHGLQTNVEATGGGVDSKDRDVLIDSIARIVQLIALAAVGAAIARDGDSTADVREARQRAECGILLIDQTAAGNCVRR